LTSEARANLRKLTGKDCSLKVTVTGYVQPTVNKVNDASLSRARARAVVDALRVLHPGAKFNVVVGKDRPIAQCVAAKNRCVTVQVRK
jgi:outer membrane protein OmpA-like peptidoglycan-associated protein